MPYRTNSDLPPSVQAHLPPHAQAIYREAFNHAFAAHVGDPRQEEAAHRLAWAAVKRSYVKIGGSWIARASAIDIWYSLLTSRNSSAFGERMIEIYSN